uniref:Uncharacterized protein n=1 Tax=Arundo donax TaxID=35708 RepID=A0A0A9CH25_ARUDO
MKIDEALYWQELKSLRPQSSKHKGILPSEILDRLSKFLSTATPVMQVCSTST